MQISQEGERYSAMDEESMATLQEIVPVSLIDQVEIMKTLGETHPQNSRVNSKQLTIL